MFPIKRLCVSDEPSPVVPPLIALYVLSALSESMEEQIFRNRLTLPAAFW